MRADNPTRAPIRGLWTQYPAREFNSSMNIYTATAVKKNKIAKNSKFIDFLSWFFLKKI